MHSAVVQFMFGKTSLALVMICILWTVFKTSDLDFYWICVCSYLVFAALFLFNNNNFVSLL